MRTTGSLPLQLLAVTVALVRGANEFACLQRCRLRSWLSRADNPRSNDKVNE